MNAARRKAAKPAVSPERRRLLARVHQLRARLGMDEETYRDALYAMAHKRSAADMTDAQLMEALSRWAHQLPEGERAAFTSQPRPGRGLGEPFQRHIRALWIDLWHLGELADGGDAALDAFVARQAKVTALRFLRAEAAPAVAEALKDWLARAGARIPASAGGREARLIVLRAQWARLGQLGAIRLALPGAIDRWAVSTLKLGARTIEQLSDDQLDHLIRAAGAWIRRVKAASDAAAR